MSEPVRAQEMRLSAVATRNPLSDNSLLTLLKNGSTAPPVLPVWAAGSSRVCVTIVGPLNSCQGNGPGKNVVPVPRCCLNTMALHAQGNGLTRAVVPLPGSHRSLDSPTSARSGGGRAKSSNSHLVFAAGLRANIANVAKFQASGGRSRLSTLSRQFLAR